MQTCTLAVDIGASSGRHIVGTVQNGKITLQEVYRFENGVHRENGHLCWDIDTLAKEVVNGLKAAHDAGFAPATIGIDTWAVDFGCWMRTISASATPSPTATSAPRASARRWKRNTA